VPDPRDRAEAWPGLKDRATAYLAVVELVTRVGPPAHSRADSDRQAAGAPGHVWAT
jgi:hypothetical protein